jgi:hypothetical protein
MAKRQASRKENEDNPKLNIFKILMSFIPNNNKRKRGKPIDKHHPTIQISINTTCHQSC